jgi:MGT family glycosyltransferase
MHGSRGKHDSAGWIGDPLLVRFLFVVIPERGHINPLVGVAQRLERAGHTLAFFSHGSIAAAIAAAGLAARVFDVPAGEARQRRGQMNANDVARLARWFELGTATVLAPKMLDTVRAAVDAFQPDVMCIDPLAYHGVAVAEASRIPWAGLSTNLLSVAPESWSCPMREANRRIATWRDELFASVGIHLEVKVNEVQSPWLRTVFTTDAFVPPSDRADSRIFLVGPSLPDGRRGDEPDFPWDRLSNTRPIVYLSSGGGQSLSFPVETLTKICNALAPGEAQLVAVLQDLVDAPFAKELPEQVLPVRYAPQLTLFGRVNAVVTHGGANTVMEALANGLPMLVVPIGHEQSLQGLLVERRGVGFTLPLDSLDTAECRQRLVSLLREDGAERIRARAIADSYRAHDGAARAAELVVELAKTRTELRP